MNNPPPPAEFDRFRQLMTQAIDGELNPGEQAEFEQLLAESPERQQEWSQYKNLKKLTMNMRYSEPPPETWDTYWTGVYRRFERGVGWILASIGAMLLLGYGGYHLVEEIVSDQKLPWLVKSAILALMAGAVILFVSVIRERLFTAKTDKYKEIQR